LDQFDLKYIVMKRSSFLMIDWLFWIHNQVANHCMVKTEILF